MIPLLLKAHAEAERPFVTRLAGISLAAHATYDSHLIQANDSKAVFAGPLGLIELEGVPASDLVGDVILVEPNAGRAERLIRANSDHNSLLVTERCDQLCQMCSQPPKKTHVDRFDAFKQACLLAPDKAIIGITGGEPTLYKQELFDLVETTLEQRPDLAFHILTNGQHFEEADIERLRDPRYRAVQWGIPLYAACADLHDEIVGKSGAYERLRQSFAHLIMAGANVELRTVVLTSNYHQLPGLARYVSSRLKFIDAWSIMQLENIGFAKNRWGTLYVDHSRNFEPVAQAIDTAVLHGVSARLFNFPRCTVPEEYRDYAAASISDWKRRYAAACDCCTQKDLCSGFFEWHPESDASGVTPL
jgi:His-Xaa-Ser system radical SAM maturase HxsC